MQDEKHELDQIIAERNRLKALLARLQTEHARPRQPAENKADYDARKFSLHQQIQGVNDGLSKLKQRNHEIMSKRFEDRVHVDALIFEVSRVLDMFKSGSISKLNTEPVKWTYRQAAQLLQAALDKAAKRKSERCGNGQDYQSDAGNPVDQ